MSLLHAGPWSGAVTETAAIVKASVLRQSKSVSLLVSQDASFAQPLLFPASSIWDDPQGKYQNRIVSIEIANLAPSTQYFYKLLIDGQEETQHAGRFKTFPEPGERCDLRIGLASCSGNDSFLNFRFPQDEVFTAIEEEEDLVFFLHLGDFHYGNIRRPVLAGRLEKFDWMLRRKTVGSLFRSVPIAYTWDDHDFLGNDTEGGLPSRHKAALSALEAYDLYVPHYPFVDRSAGIFQSFSFGRILFVLTDNRFNKITKGIQEYARTMLGARQKSWLMNTLENAGSYDLIVWANSLPWVGKPNELSPYWSAYADERTEVCNFIRDHHIRNLCMLSGDAHMLAIDDGTYTDFATGGGGGFPLFHAAALESRPNQKGGLFSKGTRDGRPGKGIAGTGQYGIMEVRYPRDVTGRITGPPSVYWTGKRIRKSKDKKFRTEILLTHDFTLAAEAPSAERETKIETQR